MTTVKVFLLSFGILALYTRAVQGFPRKLLQDVEGSVTAGVRTQFGSQLTTVEANGPISSTVTANGTLIQTEVTVGNNATQNTTSSPGLFAETMFGPKSPAPLPQPSPTPSALPPLPIAPPPRILANAPTLSPIPFNIPPVAPAPKPPIQPSPAPVGGGATPGGTAGPPFMSSPSQGVPCERKTMLVDGQFVETEVCGDSSDVSVSTLPDGAGVKVKATATTG